MIFRSLLMSAAISAAMLHPVFAEDATQAGADVTVTQEVTIDSASTLISNSFPDMNGGNPTIGEAAPGFSVTDTDGNQVNSNSLKGKIVVLEWKNHQCPFVRKHYGTGNMQALQQYAAENDIVWISIISSAEGKQGFVSAEEANDIAKEENSHAAHIVLDADGAFGQTYGAKVTPHMFVIDKDGTLAYMGGIDDTPTADPEDIETANNYVKNAMYALLAGGDVSPTTSKPYGCSVKYDY